MNLQNLISRFSPEKTLLVTEAGDHTVSDFLLRAEKLRRNCPSGKDSRVVIEAKDPFLKLSCLVALDGHVGALFPVPESLLEDRNLSDLEARFASTHRITDSGLIERSANSSDYRPEPTSENDNFQTQWVLPTSGTTGVPKLIQHTTYSLTKTCKTDSHRGNNFVWGLVYDPFRFAGLQVVLQSFASGSPLVLGYQGPTIQSQVQLFSEHNVNALSATPTYWRKLLMTGLAATLYLDQITLGGEPSDKAILKSLANTFPDARIAHIYASTEAGVGFSVTDKAPGFPLAFLKKGINGNQLKISPHDTLQIRPDDQESSALRANLMDEEGYIDTGDLVEIAGNRVFFKGRDSGAINVGGNKVIPEEVESVIRMVPGVGEVRVKGKSSGMMGQIVIAEVELSPEYSDSTSLKSDIMTACKTELDRYKVPALVRFVKEVPLSPAGKIIRS